MRVLLGTLQPPNWRRWGARLGLPGFLALTLLVLSSWGEWSDVERLVRQTQQVRSDAQAIRKSIQDLTQQQGRSPNVELQALTDLLSTLTDTEGRTVVLEGILNAVRHQGMHIETWQWRPTDETVALSLDAISGGLMNGALTVSRQQIDLPLSGTYEQIRACLEQLLKEQPAVSLDALEVKRADAATEKLNVHLTLSVWVKSQSRGVKQRAAPGPSGKGVKP